MGGEKGDDAMFMVGERERAETTLKAEGRSRQEIKASIAMERDRYGRG